VKIKPRQSAGVSYWPGAWPGDRVACKGKRNPQRRRRFNYAGDAAGLTEGERTGAKKTGQRDRTRRNWDEH
jgi:hypothetical protein